MKRLAAFLKATTRGGLFVVLPLIIVLAVLTKAVMTVHAVAQSIVGKLAGEDSEAAHFPIIFSVLILVGISFVCGLAVTSRRGLAACRWIEERVLFRVPGYAAVRAIVGGFAGMKGEGVVKSGLLTIDEGMEAFVLVVEDHGDGRLTVFVPCSPNPAGGNVQVVRKDLVRMLNVPMKDIGSVLQQCGVGSAKVLAKDNAATPADLPSSRT
jgi:uncharacterized membrane protein